MKLKLSGSSGLIAEVGCAGKQTEGHLPIVKSTSTCLRRERERYIYIYINRCSIFYYSTLPCSSSYINILYSYSMAVHSV